MFPDDMKGSGHFLFNVLFQGKPWNSLYGMLEVWTKI
jgi:hypothetical protein